MAQLALRHSKTSPPELPRSRPSLRFRVNSRLSGPRTLAVILKLFSARGMSVGGRARWQAAGVTARDLDEVLPTIRSMNDWWTKWFARAERREADAQAARDAGRRHEATRKFLEAFGLYYISALGLFLHPERLAPVARRIAESYAQAAPYLNPPARRVAIPFDGVYLAAYFRLPSQMVGWSDGHMHHAADQQTNQPANQLTPLVILVNGTATVKEELRAMEETFLARGLATLSVDVPGMGESWQHVGSIIEQERVAQAALQFLQTIPAIDVQRVGLFGISLGGLSVLRMAAHLHRFKAVAAVCPPYDGASYFHIVPQYIRDAIRHMSKLSADEFANLVQSSSLRGQVRHIRAPMLIVGAGRDMIVPSGDARLILREATCEKELLWYERDEHGALAHLHDWPSKVADWMARRLISDSEAVL